MDNALYVGLSRQMTLRREMEIVANNIANLDTTGFKVEQLMVRSDAAPGLDGPRSINFVVSDGVARDFAQGALRRTDGPLDLAIEGQGFFQVEGPDGPAFTRDGRFRTDEQGRLTTQLGLPVMGDGGGQIVIDTEKGPVSLGSDGTISQGDERIGKVGLFTFENLGALEKTGDNLFRNTSNLQAQPAQEARVRQGMLEGSNVQSILEITRMIEVSRAYQQTAKMMESESDLSRTTVQRLGRVN